MESLERIYRIEIECHTCGTTHGYSELSISDSGIFIVKFTCITLEHKSIHAFTYQQLLEIALLQRITSEQTLLS